VQPCNVHPAIRVKQEGSRNRKTSPHATNQTGDNNMIKFVNMTPHVINVIKPNSEKKIEPSGDTIRLVEDWNKINRLGGIDVLICYYSSEVELPPILDDTYYIVSAMIANAFPEREDFLIVAKTIRDENGHIAGCKAFARITNN